MNSNQNMLTPSNYKYEYEDKFQYLTHICLNVTDDCNLHCKYCFVEQHPHYMTYQVAKDAVDWIYNNLQKKRELGYCEKNDMGSVNFFGGEPTLMWDQIIVPITKYIKKNYKDDIFLGITTNGTLLNEERIKFLKDNQINLLLSIDGGPDTQNQNRPCKDPKLKSFDLVSKNIPKILEYYPNVTFRATIDQSSVSTMFESYLYAEKLGFKQMFQIPNEREQWTEANTDILKEEIKKIYYYNLQYFLNNQVPPLSYELINRSFSYIKWIDTQRMMKNTLYHGDKLCERCGLGVNYGSIAYDGTIYGCQEQDSRSTSDIFKLGNIYTGGIEAERHKRLTSLYSKQGTTFCEKPSLCEHCKMRLRCFDDCCPSVSYDMFNNFNTKTKINCIFYQTLIDNALVLMQILVPQNNLAFKYYLDCLYANEQREEKIDGN